MSTQYSDTIFRYNQQLYQSWKQNLTAHWIQGIANI